MTPIPYLPDNAPFTPEQRAYLNGFLAGLFARVAPGAPGPAAAPTGPPPALEKLAIFFGSQTGNAEKLARRAAREAGKRGFAPTVHDLGNVPAAQLRAEGRALMIASTFGDGEPPDNARAFWDGLQTDTAPRLEGLQYSVCALGDTSYPKFCAFGRELDARLERLGARRVQARVDCDTDFEAAFLGWLDAALGALAPVATAGPSSAPVVEAGPSPGGKDAEEERGWSRSRPYLARLLASRRLNGAGSAKDVRHVEIALADSGLEYEAGDALGVQPSNDPALVAELLAVLGRSGEEEVPGPEGRRIPLREALTHHHEITRIPRALLENLARRTGDPLLVRVASPEANGDLTAFLRGREVIDLLLAHPGPGFAPDEFVSLLRKLAPRLYSISSSPKAHPGAVHLTVGTVRYESLGRRRSGVCSTFLADRVTPDTPVPVHVHRNPAFRPPPPDRPLIMVGPGTGIAPFRAFLEERKAIGAGGRNWLFFGDQRSSTDFLYREEIEQYRESGLLTRLDLAWSRDQEQKVYVQDRMVAEAAELWRWLEGGAAFYVCGDASRMAKDVDAALHRVVMAGGGRSAEGAAEYVNRLKAEKRYQRDVY